MTLKALLGNQYQSGLTEAVRRCVELDPKRRIGSAKELRDLLQPRWYEFLLQYGKHNAMTALVILLAAGGIAFWNTQQPAPAEQKLPEGVVALQDKNGAAVNENKVAAGTRKKEKNEVAGNNDSGAGISEANQKEDGRLNRSELSANQPATNETKTVPPIVSSKKSDAAKETAAGRANAVQFSGSNWNAFQKTEQHLGPRVPNADKVVYPPGQWPQVTIQNNSDAPLKNPQAVLYFNDFGVVGSDFSVKDHADKMISSRLSGKGENGVARTVTLRYDGTVPPHESYRLNLFGGIGGLFKTGPRPYVRVVFSADNADVQEKSYTIGVR
jgi:hypothetical protein